jgi:hypothetical protein
MFKLWRVRGTTKSFNYLEIANLALSALGAVCLASCLFWTGAGDANIGDLATAL